MSRVPLDYGDNFPVPSGDYWNPSVPWRFPKHQVRIENRSLFRQVLPWFMLGLGMTMGIVWMSWRVVPESSATTVTQEMLSSPKKIVPTKAVPAREPASAPRSQPARLKSRLA